MPSRAPEHDNSAAVDARLADSSHPLKAAVAALRACILESDTAITEGVKWNSVSFYCCGWFATIGCRKPGRLDLVWHNGAEEFMGRREEIGRIAGIGRLPKGPGVTDDRETASAGVVGRRPPACRRCGSFDLNPEMEAW